MKRLYVSVIILLVTALACTAGTAASLYAPGYYASDLEISVPSGAFVSGFDLLPNGSFVINDGRSIRELSRTGQPDVDLYTFDTQVYGSFVRYNPADGRVYFGESSTGSVSAFSYADPGTVTSLATILNNFDMDFRNGVPYVVGCDSTWSETSIYLLDGSSTDLIATCPGPSGPIAFDAVGDLIYVPASYTNMTRIVKWTSAQVAGAIGASSLSVSNSSILAAIEAGYGAAINSAGGLMFTNNSVWPAAIQVYGNGTVSTLATFAEPGGVYPFVSLVRENTATGEICAVVSYFDAEGASHTMISSMVTPEPSTMLATLGSLIGLAGSVGLLRRRGK